jgi:cell division protein FtsB
MKNIQKHLTIENIAVILAFVFALFCAVGAVASLQKNYELLSRVREGRLTNEVLKIKNANLRLQQVYYQTDEFMELQARAKLNKAMSGENLVLLPKGDTTAIKTEEVKQVESKELTNQQKWAQFLLGVRYD